MGIVAPPRHQHVIRREQDGSRMWLMREEPVSWGPRELAIRYRSKGEAARAIVQLRLGAASIEPLA